MNFKDYLISLDWNSFTRYPNQDSSIYLHCFTEDNSIHKFFKIKRFNAVFFDFKKLVQSTPNKHQWQFAWLPTESIDENYDKSITD